MRKLILSIAAALALSGCGFSISTAGTAPAPLAATSLDEKAFVIALKAADTIASTVDALVAAKVIVKGTPRALAVKSALIRLQSGLEAASAAQRAGSATSYAVAISEASAALDAVKSAIGR